MSTSRHSRARNILVALAAATLLLLPGPRAMAQGVSVPYINAVDLDIDPAHLDEYKSAIKENGAATAKEPGCRQFDILVLNSNPNHIFLYEVYENEVAFKAHRASDHFKHYAATTGTWVKERNARPMTPVAFNARSK
jgi:(4S)-4-hydroxy-5-phosphonooxypentane-2,3-dione isomerase